MTIPTALEVNCETGEVTERPLTAEEIAANEIAVVQAEADRIAREDEALAKATAKADLLEKLGITQEEAALLLS
jgi:hypothetical protein